MSEGTVRDTWIDVAKGIAIIAIVLGHVLRGLEATPSLDTDPAVFEIADKALYMCHLSVFVFLSGLFVAEGVEKRGRVGYLIPRLKLFLYLYVLWQVLQVTVKLFTASSVNNPPSGWLLVQLWKSEGQLWYLPFLLISTVLAVTLKPWVPSRSALWLLSGSILLSLAAWGIDGDFVGTRGLPLIGFFFAACYLGHRRIRHHATRLPSTRLVLYIVSSGSLFIITAFWTAAIPPTINYSDRSPIAIGWGVASSILGTIFILSLAVAIARTGLFSWLAFLGTRSLEIFLAHIIASSGTRIILTVLGVDSLPVHIISGVLAGTLLPLLMWFILKDHFPWFFTPPKILHSRANKVTVRGVAP